MISVTLRRFRELSPKAKGLLLLVIILIPTTVVIALFIGINLGRPNAPCKILFIGNSLSYNNEGVDVHVEQLGNCTSPPRFIETDTVYGESAQLAILYPASTSRLTYGTYDYVIVQGTPEFGFESFMTNARLIIEAIREVGAKPILFMTWNHLAKPPWAGDYPWNETFELMSIQEIAQAHYDLAEEYNVMVAPVGLAFEKVNVTRPGFQLYADMEHSSMNGTYLAALVIYATIFGESPVGFTWWPTSPPFPSYCRNVTAENADFLQGIAWETVQENLPPFLKNLLLNPYMQCFEVRLFKLPVIARFDEG